MASSIGSGFVARSTYPFLESLPRSYFLGHHKAGLDKMKSLVASVDLVIECRDYRIPLTSANPLLETALGRRNRLVVFTKKDLGGTGSPSDILRDNRLLKALKPSSVLFSDFHRRSDINKIITKARRMTDGEGAEHSISIMGTQAMVVGMPNVGKSTLINALRNVGMKKGKAVRTGNQPGVTRKIGSTVKIAQSGDSGGSDLYVLDTPGIFMPYVSDPYAMLKLALCGSVKDTVIPPITVADYLLYHINLVDPSLYSQFSQPTNDIHDLLGKIALKMGRLRQGGAPDYDNAALWLIQRWRVGQFGKFILDSIETEEALHKAASIQSHSLDKPSFRKARILERTSRGRSLQSE